MYYSKANKYLVSMGYFYIRKLDIQLKSYWKNLKNIFYLKWNNCIIEYKNLNIIIVILSFSLRFDILNMW